MKRRHALLATAAALTPWGAPALAQAFPSKPLTLIVPFPPGGLADIVARPVAEALGRELGQPVVIDNKPGAGGGIGMGAAAKARPDGHTLLMALSSLTVIPEADALLGARPCSLCPICGPLPVTPPIPRCWWCEPMPLGSRCKSL